MKKYKFLGINLKSGKCCVLSCVVPFDKLIPGLIEASDFSHSSTNWGGRDDIERTLKLEGLQLTGKKILLKEPLAFSGEDHDSGFRYGWTISVDVIAETADAPEEPPEKPPEKPHWYDIAMREGRAEPVARIKQGKTYLYEEGRSCVLEFNGLNDIQNFIMHIVSMGREFENGYTIIFPNDQGTVDKFNKILAKEQ